MQKECVECNKLSNKSAHAKVRHDALVEKLKRKLCSVVLEQKKEEHAEKNAQRKRRGECVRRENGTFEELKLDSEHFSTRPFFLCPESPKSSKTTTATTISERLSKEKTIRVLLEKFSCERKES